MKLRVAAVVQRFGKEVIGGESLALQVLSRLNSSVDLTVITTCAEDYVTWANKYPAGEHREGDLRVLRFPVRNRRWIHLFNLVSRVVLQRRLPRFSSPPWLEEAWIELQGPRSPELLEHIRANRKSYDVFIFYTYLYYPTVKGLPLVAEKSILVPTAHDERPIYLRPYRRLFESAAALIYLTVEEQEFANRLFGNSHKPQRVAAMRVALAEDQGIPTSRAVKVFLESRGIDRPYFVYLGRVDVAKGVDRMFSYFERYRREKPDSLLVLAGTKHAPIPESSAFRYLGVLTEEEKRAVLLGSRGLIHFSPFESFSISLLEAFGLGRPAIVPVDSVVLAGHVERSGAGFAISNYSEFEAAANTLLAGADELGKKGTAYVKENYSWEKVDEAYLALIRQVAGN